MEKEEAIKHFGSATNLARALGIAHSAVSQWGQSVPLLRAYQIERITQGKLKVRDPEHKQASKYGD